MNFKEYLVFLVALIGGYTAGVLLGHYVWGWGGYLAAFAGGCGAIIGSGIYATITEILWRKKK